MTERHRSAITDHGAQENHTIKWDKAKMVMKERGEGLGGKGSERGYCNKA